MYLKIILCKGNCEKVEKSRYHTIGNILWNTLKIYVKCGDNCYRHHTVNMKILGLYIEEYYGIEKKGYICLVYLNRIILFLRVKKIFTIILDIPIQSTPMVEDIIKSYDIKESNCFVFCNDNMPSMRNIYPYFGWSIYKLIWRDSSILIKLYCGINVLFMGILIYLMYDVIKNIIILTAFGFKYYDKLL